MLGGFEVRVGGEPVPLPAWRSRQARTLVKVLASRRGRPVTRDSLCELIWPDDDPAKTGHRLSVLLATVRGVLDPARRGRPTTTSPATPPVSGSTSPTSRWTPTVCFATPPTVPT